MGTNSSTAIVVGGLAALGLALVVGGVRLFSRRAGKAMQVEAGIENEEQSLQAKIQGDLEALGNEPSNAAHQKLPLDYFALVFAMTIPFWLFGEQPLPVPMKLPVSALASFNPMFAALILTYRRKGRSGVRELFQRVLDYRKIKNKLWYLPILGLSPLLMVLSYAVMRMARLPLPDPQIPWLAAPVLFLVFFIFAIGEELGWMGYAFDPMQNRWGALRASIVLGIVWGLFHLIPDLQNQQTASWILWQRLGSVAIRILVTWVYNNTGGSVFSAILYHAMNNLSWVLFPNYGSHYDPFVTGVITIGAAAIVLSIWGPKTLTRNRFARPGGPNASNLQERGTA